MKVTQQVIAGTTEAARICGATTISDSQVHSASISDSQVHSALFN